MEDSTPKPKERQCRHTVIIIKRSCECLLRPRVPEMPEDPKPQDSNPQSKPENVAQKLHALLKALDGLAIETDPIFEAPVLDSMAYFWTKSIQEHHKSLKHQQELLQKLQRDTLKIRKDLNLREAMITIRAHNSRLSKWENVKYPPGISVNDSPLPLTREKLLQMNNIQCQFTAGYLELPNLPGSASLEERRKQIADYLGVQYLDYM